MSSFFVVKVKQLLLKSIFANSWLRFIVFLEATSEPVKTMYDLS